MIFLTVLSESCIIHVSGSQIWAMSSGEIPKSWHGRNVPVRAAPLCDACLARHRRSHPVLPTGGLPGNNMF